MYSILLPGYSVGTECYGELPYITRRYGRKAVVVGGKRSMEKIKQALLAGIEGSEVKILDFIWYGGNSSYENIAMLKNKKAVAEADMIFGAGGGRVCDTVKVLGAILDKPVFTFPTLASNCAASTAISVLYNEDGTFREYYYLKEPPIHIFINTEIIAQAPSELFWAGIGDALSKEYEVLFSSRDKFIYHTPFMGIALAKVCTEPLLEYGKKALADCKKGIVSFELEQVALDILISTGLVSNFVTHESQADSKDNYYYNSSLAHCVYYGSSLIPACGNHLHGEIVAFGVLCLLTYDNQLEERDRIMEFNGSIGLPITMEEIGLIQKDLAILADKAANVIEWKYVPGKATKEKFIQAITDTNKAGHEYLNKLLY